MACASAPSAHEDTSRYPEMMNTDASLEIDSMLIGNCFALLPRAGSYIPRSEQMVGRLRLSSRGMRQHLLYAHSR